MLTLVLRLAALFSFWSATLFRAMLPSLRSRCRAAALLRGARTSHLLRCLFRRRRRTALLRRTRTPDVLRWAVRRRLGSGTGSALSAPVVPRRYAAFARRTIVTRRLRPATA